MFVQQMCFPSYCECFIRYIMALVKMAAKLTSFICVCLGQYMCVGQYGPCFNNFMDIKVYSFGRIWWP